MVVVCRSNGLKAVQFASSGILIFSGIADTSLSPFLDANGLYILDHEVPIDLLLSPCTVQRCGRAMQTPHSRIALLREFVCYYV